ncbi:hypothetical protein [Rhodanobacter sp. B04]|uniref:hypothetical protein n=1 Tax=Rhodanobacter sp. B04 TaxID=1945860 RepID=UPI001C2BA4EE|nr:hypothetical protein [Rhodanobacter sp. B04]
MVFSTSVPAAFKYNGNRRFARTIVMATGQLDPLLLHRLAAKYVWWKGADEAAVMPERVIAQTMNMGDYDDVLALSEQLGDDRLRRVLQHAEIGQFNERSWAYWHYRLGMAKPGVLPPLPKRRLG